MGSASVALYDKLVVPTMRLMESVVTLPIGKNALLIARKAANQDMQPTPSSFRS